MAIRTSTRHHYVFFVNTLRPRQNGCHFADGTFKRNFLNENVRISIKMSLKFVPNCPINNVPALVKIMVWRRPGDKPLSEPMMVSLLTHKCVTRHQWVNLSRLFFYGLRLSEKQFSSRHTRASFHLQPMTGYIPFIGFIYPDGPREIAFLWEQLHFTNLHERQRKTGLFCFMTRVSLHANRSIVPKSVFFLSLIHTESTN